MVKAFEGQYPGVKVEAYRVAGADITVRMMEEAKAKRYIADTVETTEGNLMFMRDAFLLRPYHSPHFASYPEDAKGRASAAYTSGPSRASPTSASPTTRNFFPKTPCRKTTKGCCIPSSKAVWEYPSAIPPTKSSARSSEREA
jgi:ABC-type Fe3+ transport system substrate-binding protein